LELLREKKPRAKSAPLEMSMSPWVSGFACVSCSSDLQDELKNRKMERKTGIKAVFLVFLLGYTSKVGAMVVWNNWSAEK
jgi:hypothetical protein